jgi:small-conductance mechanosensitive channel
MIRFLLALPLLLLAGAAAEQSPAAPPIPPAASASAPAPAAALTPAQAAQALEVLQDDTKRAQVIAVLEALAKVAPAAAPAAPAAPAAAAAAEPKLSIPLAPDSLGAQILVDASNRLSSLSGELVGTAQAVTDFPLLWRFIVDVANDQWSRRLLLDAGWKLLVVAAVGLAAQWAARRLLRRPMQSLRRRAAAIRIRPTDDEPAPEDLGLAEAERGQTEKLWHRLPSALLPLRRLPVALARLLLELLPVLAMLATGYALLGAGLGTEPITRLVILGLLHAYVLCRVATSVVRMLVGPGDPRLFAVPDETAVYVLHWVRRIAAVAIFGYALAEIGLLFGLYRGAHDALIKLVALVVGVFLAVIVLQNRAAVAGWIRAREEADGVLAVLRNRLAGRWHFIAIAYLLALWVVWAMDVPNGFSRLLRIFIATTIILTLARLLQTAVVGAIDRAARVSPQLAERYPGLQARIGSYHPVVRVLLQCAIGVIALVALLQAWGFDALSWFDGNALAGRLISAVGTIATTLVLSLLVWEAVNAALQRHLNRLAREGQAGRSARLRTLLPMLRTTLFVSIALFAGLMVLGEIGVNIAPLLAGAGVIGLAIGFGSQKLVQDIITGLFLLLENTMQVGDTVSLGGLSGTVENLSVRTIRLRALDGSVHIVPFSAVTTVTNMTRDFGYAVIDVEISVNEDIDRIAEVLSGIGREMRAEPRWASVIRDDLEVMGVDRFLATTLVLRARVRTTPAQRWAVGRELNRRIKQRFDELAIEAPMTSYLVLSRPPHVAAPVVAPGAG